MSSSHQALIAQQFGPKAQAYVDSRVHAQGRDLVRLKALVETKPGGRILDLGCGGGHVSFTLAPFAEEIVAYDLSRDMLAAVDAECVKRGLSTVRTHQGTAEALPFADHSFDLVVTRFSAHHWSDLGAGLAGMRRVLKPAGRAIVIDVYGPEEPRHDTFLQSIEFLRDPSHVRDYTLKEWTLALAAAGLKAGAPETDRLRMDFQTWIERIGTPEVRAHAIRSLQMLMPRDVIERFAIESDGSFLLDTMMIEAEV
jgi:SAM-dependent methyltransferase